MRSRNGRCTGVNGHQAVVHYHWDIENPIQGLPVTGAAQRRHWKLKAETLPCVQEELLHDHADRSYPIAAGASYRADYGPGRCGAG